MSKVAKETVVQLKNYGDQELSDRVSDTVNSVTNSLMDGLQILTARAKAAAKSTDGLVRESPWQAVGVVALTGFAVGYFVAQGIRRASANASEE